MILHSIIGCKEIWPKLAITRRPGSMRKIADGSR
jgi:hypothetical protein